MELNWATIEVEKTEDKDIRIEVSIKNYYNEDVQKQTYLVGKDLKFDLSKTKLSKMCEAVHFNHKRMLTVLRNLESFI